MARRYLIPMLAVVLLPVIGPTEMARARNQPTAAPYAPGWNMAGGPPGTNLSSAQALFAYGSGGYVAAGTQVTAPCHGAWAFFSSAASVPLPDQAPASGTQTCPVAAGWNMVGNPFVTAAELPSNTVAYDWTPASGQYVIATTIPVGGAVWIYTASPSSVTLWAQPQPPMGTLTIAPPFAPEYRAHVGDTIELLLPNPTAYTAHADPAYLQLIDSGATQSYPETQFWRWRAIAAGQTDITLDPACRQAIPPCGAPSLVLRLVIQL